jgi:ribose-phosphate pyrophosphokinase
MTPADTPLIVAGTSHPQLAREISRISGWPLADVTIKRFACNEIYVRFNENVRRRDIVIVQSPHVDIDQHIWELLTLVDAARGASAGTITALIPCLPYARQDKTGHGREAITPRLLATVLEAAGVNHVMTMDLHTGQLQGVFRIPCDNLTAEPLLMTALKKDNVGGSEWVVAAPDAGRVKLARRYAAALGSELVVLSKERSAHNQAHTTRVIGSQLVSGRHVLVIDDMIDTAGTLVASAKALREVGARTVSVACTHAIFSDPARQLLFKKDILNVWACDTLPIEPAVWLEIVPTAQLWADALQRVRDGDSLSQLFDGHNQEF